MMITYDIGIIGEICCSIDVVRSFFKNFLNVYFLRERERDRA